MITGAPKAFVIVELTTQLGWGMTKAEQWKKVEVRLLQTVR